MRRESALCRGEAPNTGLLRPLPGRVRSNVQFSAAQRAVLRPEGRACGDQNNRRIAAGQFGASLLERHVDYPRSPYRTGKTGTTSLQSFFAANDAILKQSSIVYPRTGRKKDKHNWLARSLRSVDDLSRLLAELHEECSGFEHALVSCEEFSHAFLDAAVLEQFCRLARERFHIRIIIYLRRQDQLKESVYAQVVREWFCGSILDENHYEYDHLKRLNLLGTQIPKQDLIVRRHVTSSGVEQDFLAIYGLVLADGFKLVPRRRVSGSRRLTAVLGLVDKRALQFPGALCDISLVRISARMTGFDISCPPSNAEPSCSSSSRQTARAEQYFPSLMVISSRALTLKTIIGAQYLFLHQRSAKPGSYALE